MSNMRDGPVLKAVAEVVKEHVGKAFDVLRGRINAVEEAVKALPKPERGEIGPQGIAGEKGLDGAPGIRGDQGLVGPAGANGKDGRDGIDGAKGNDGAAGKDGKDGLDGKPGEDGEKGFDGKDGLQGSAGLKGLDGKDGRDGSDGKDAPPVDTKALSGQIIEEVLGQIPAPVHGKDGRDGRDAEQLDVNEIVSKILGQIPPPIPGKDGASVDPEAVRILVAGEVSKAVAALPKPTAGRDGRDGRPGDKGDSGKDALEIDILNGIDESMSYQRGVFAQHRNGLFRAYRTTDPVIEKNYEAAGWICVVPGIVDIVEASGTDKRTIIKTHELSDGSLITTRYKTPSVIYQGVFKDGTEYESGDAVTSAGAMWICGQATKDKPGISKAWTLAVKRGSDGKDLRPKDDDRSSGGAIYLGAGR